MRSLIDTAYDGERSRPFTDYEMKAINNNNRHFSEQLEPMPRSAWPDLACKIADAGVPILNVWRSRYFLVQVYDENRLKPGLVRMTVHRTTVSARTRRWDDRITWDELQAIKNAVGFATAWMIEIFPPENEVINAAPMRHLWLLPEVAAFAWRRKSDGKTGA